MATIKKRGNSYLIRCYDGYDQTGRQIERTMTWKIPAGMSEKKAEREARHQAELFEEKVRTGQSAEQKIKFADFCDLWMKDYAKTQLRPKTVNRYQELLERIKPALRHTNATLQIANGVAITTVAGTLGHSTANTTTKVYAHAIQSAAAASAEMMDNLLNPIKKQT